MCKYRNVCYSSYSIFPKSIDRMETKKSSRKFPIILYDLREVDNIRVFSLWLNYLKEDNAELKQVDLSTIVSTVTAFSHENMEELPVVEEEAKSISLTEGGGLQISNQYRYIILFFLLYRANDPIMCDTVVTNYDDLTDVLSFSIILCFRTAKLVFQLLYWYQTQIHEHLFLRAK